MPLQRCRAGWLKPSQWDGLIDFLRLVFLSYPYFSLIILFFIYNFPSHSFSHCPLFPRKLTCWRRATRDLILWNFLSVFDPRCKQEDLTVELTEDLPEDFKENLGIGIGRSRGSLRGRCRNISKRTSKISLKHLESNSNQFASEPSERFRA